MKDFILNDHPPSDHYPRALKKVNISKVRGQLIRSNSRTFSTTVIAEIFIRVKVRTLAIADFRTLEIFVLRRWCQIHLYTCLVFVYY